MHIETDYSIYLSRVNAPRVELVEDTESRVMGFERSGRIGITRMKPLSAVTYYFHEMGHVIEDLDTVSILTPDQVKQTRVNLSTPDAIYLAAYLNGTEEGWMPRWVRKICDSFIRTYTRWTFDPAAVGITYFTNEQIAGVINRRGSHTVRRMGDDSVQLYVYRGDAHACDTELDSVLCQVGCLHILENSLKANKLLKAVGLDMNITIGKHDMIAYQRAQNIVARAYTSTGWVIR